MNFAEELHRQQQQLDKLLGRVEGALANRRSTLNDADRKYYSYIDSIQFGQQDNTAQDITFTVPEMDYFVGKRLSLYPSFRFVSTDAATDGPNEVSFRPCVFPSYGGALMPRGSAAANRFLPPAMVDCFISISENYNDGSHVIARNYQNLPSPVASFFSNGVNLQPVAGSGIDRYYPNFSFPTTLMFDEDWLLPGGSSITIKIAPSFAGVREDGAAAGASATRQNEYRVTAVLEGFKKVRR